MRSLYVLEFSFKFDIALIYRRTGSMKPISGPTKKQDLKDRHNPMKSKRKPPRGMHLTHEDLKSIALGPPGQGDAILKSMDSEVISLKRQVGAVYHKSTE